jgi:GNAT superfamily N-acetyltransferase
MVPLDPLVVRSLRSWLGEPSGPGLLALHHALAFQRPGLWGDHARVPRSVVLVREGDDQLEAFGAGEPEPAVSWLIAQGRAVSLVAPASWRDEVSARAGPIEQGVVETWTIDPFDLEMTTMLNAPGPAPESGLTRLGKGKGTGKDKDKDKDKDKGKAKPSGTEAESNTPSRLVATRRLIASDAAAFAAVAPPSALRGWGSFSALIGFGAGFCVPYGDTFASLAWIFDQSTGFDAISVFTVPRYRRLGLARASASALIAHVARQRHKVPLWSTTPENDASLALARSLGFMSQATEPLIRWPPRPRPVALSQPSEEAE